MTDSRQPYFFFKKNRKKKHERLRKYIKRIVLALLFFGAGATLGLAIVFYYYSLSLPPIGPLLEGYDPPQTTRILTADGVVIGELFEERRTVVPIERIPKIMMDAVIAAEDADFRSHEGLDYMGIIRAALRNIRKGRIAQGASTITQQVARTFFLSRKRTFSRKFREILLTRKIEQRLTKDEILYLYLNQIDFGHRRYGVFEACKFYFNKSIDEITLAEAALLAGIPNGTTIYSPVLNPARAKKRRAYVLGEMEKLGMISSSEAEQARNAPLSTDHRGRPDSSLAPEAVSLAVAAMKKVVDINQLKRGGYTIHTTIDAKLQREARRAVVDGLMAIDIRHRRVAPYAGPKKEKVDLAKGALREGRIYWAEVTGADTEKNRLLLRIAGREGYVNLDRAARYNPNKLPPDQFAKKGAALRVSLTTRPDVPDPLRLRLEMGPQAALVGLRSSDGAVLAVVGGDRGVLGGFDRATRAKRQPGSAFKPFTYLAALETGRYTAATLLDDAPEVQGEWQPQNSHPDDFSGAVRLREALARSLNLPAVKLITEVGPEAVTALAKRLGITSTLEPGPSLALGASAITPLEMAVAYGALSNGGKRNGPRIIQQVEGPDGSALPVMPPPSLQAVSEQEAYLLTSLLESVVKGGTGAKARELKRPVAGKTGTSNQQRDAWFVGYSPDIVCSVWVGFDDFKSIGRKEYGARAALPIWIDFMKAAHETLVKKEFVPPAGILSLQIDPKTGLLAYEGMEERIEEIFIEGTEPTETAVPPDLVSPEAFLMDQLGGGVVDAGPGAPEAP